MRIIFKFVISFLIILFLLITYLSLFGIETQRFNNQIIKKIKSVNSDLNIKLKTIKIIFDPFQFDVNVKTIGPALSNKNENIEIESIKAKVSLKSLINKKFSIENLQISTKSLDAKSLITFVRSINQKPELYVLEKIVKKGFLIADIKLEFDSEGKIKDNYKIKGFLKDGKLSFNDGNSLDKLDLIFNSKYNELKIIDTNFKLNNINFKSEEILIKNEKNKFSFQGDISHEKFDLKNKDFKHLISPFIKKLNFTNLSFVSKNKFSFYLDRKFEIKDLDIKSSMNLLELSILNDYELSNFFPKIKEEILLSDNNLKINYTKKNLSVIGEGKILIQDNEDDIFYKIDQVNKDIKFETSIQINDNPINIDFLSYEKKIEKALINFKGIKEDKENLLISSFSYKEKENIFDFQKINFNEFFQINKLDKLELNYFDKDNRKNSISLFRKNKEYFLSGSYFNADNLIENLFESDQNKSILININNKLNINIDKVRLDKDNILKNFVGHLTFKNKKINNGKLEGLFTSNKKLKLTINKKGNNRITTLFLDRAEPIIRRYKFIKGFEQGVLDFYSTSNGEETRSTLKIYNFKLKEMPALTKVLTLASLQGIADIMSGEGIRFDEFEMNFKDHKDLINIEEIYAIGPAISILMEGYIEKKRLISLRGTLVPATTINKFIGSIPVLGNILVGAKTGEGVFGVSFKIKGPPKNLETTVNPVKTLTPRFITRTLEKIKKN
tara:strand:+ start:5269 stop:7452 length:2184 start_codon:yes stop_codon:yes gene_type:complete